MLGIAMQRCAEPGTDGRATARARAHYLAALDRSAHFDDGGATRALRAARTADPAYLPAFIDPLETSAVSFVPPALARELDSLAAAQPDSALGSCLRSLVAGRYGRWSPIDPPPGASRAARTCLAHHRTLVNPGRHGRAGRDSIVRALWGAFPESPMYARAFAAMLEEAGAWGELLAVASQMTEAGRPLLLRSVGYAKGSLALHWLGRHADAARMERDGRDALGPAAAGARLAYLHGIYFDHASLVREAGGDSAVVAHAHAAMADAEHESALLARRADVLIAAAYRVHRAEWLLDNGALVASVSAWDSLDRMADSLDALDLLSRVRMRRGRALVKLGRAEDAERDLLAGREAARRIGNLIVEYEAEHNLLHLYEAVAGRDEEARRAGEAFVALTRLGGLTPVQLMAHRDLAWFYLRRGERERARAQFEAVVAYADSLPGLEYWAGEYYELIGDLDGAEASYRRTGLAHDARALAGLARLAEATSDVDRAVRYARAYDGALEAARVPEYAPLLPGLLARQGRVAEAIEGLDRARGRARDRGQIAAWGALSVDLAVLELRRGRLAAAAAVADSAAAAAARVAGDEVALRARAIAGLARTRLGQEAGLAQVRVAQLQARRTRIPQLEAEVGTWYGAAVAAAGEPRAALAVFDRAADLTDSIAASLALDPARAGFHAAQSTVSNAALGVTLDHAREPWAPGQYADWSVRRKRPEAPLRDGAPPPASGRAIVESLRSRLGPDRAVIDYVVLDTTVAALVVTDRAARIVRLPVAADVLRSQVSALGVGIAPRVGSFVDRSRAAFDLAIARRLCAELLAPLDSLLGDRIQLTIVPDAPLHLVPFDALVVSGSDTAPAFALDRYLITLAASLSDVAASGARVPPGDVIAFAGPTAAGDAVGADREVDALADALRGQGEWHVTRFEGPAATEDRVREHASHATVLHFAAHARPNASQPDYGLVALASEGSDDGRLYAHEIRHLRLPGSLVVLSACESAAGRLAGGEGPLSLSRAFLQAGASAVLGTLWPVDETAAGLMEEFYRGLARGDPPAVALRTAKLARRGGPDPSPLRWAAFELVGGSVRAGPSR